MQMFASLFKRIDRIKKINGKLRQNNVLLVSEKNLNYLIRFYKKTKNGLRKRKINNTPMHVSPDASLEIVVGTSNCGDSTREPLLLVPFFSCNGTSLLVPSS